MGSNWRRNLLVSAPKTPAPVSDLFEDEPSDLPVGIAVRGLRKVFSHVNQADVVAVDDVSFRAFKGSVTTLLGHNGAGKTTTMNVLTGGW